MEVWFAHNLPLWPLESTSYKTINDYTINAKWSSSHMTVCGWDARHLLWWSCRCNTCPLLGRFHNFRIRQLPFIHLSVFWTAVGILTVCISYDEDFLLLMSFTLDEMRFILHIWSWLHVVFRLVGRVRAESWFSFVDFTFFLKKPSISLLHFSFFKFLSLFSLCLLVSFLFPPLIHGWLYYH